MNGRSRFAALFAYLVPVIGWLYVVLLERKDRFAVYHLRQAIGLVLFLIGTLAGWAVIAWLLAWIPYAAVIGVALFSIVIAAYLYGAAAWVMGMLNALGNRLAPLPIFGQWASRLPIGQIA